VQSLSQPCLWNEQAAHAKLEEIAWPGGPVCPYCGATDRIGSVRGKAARLSLKFCSRCRKQFRATVGTLFEGSHVPLHKWFQAIFLLTASNSTISTHRLHLRLEVTNKTASNMRHRIEGALNRGHDGQSGSFGGASWTATFGRKQMEGRSSLMVRRLSAASRTSQANAAGNADMPWTTAAIRSLERLPAASTRQFLAFIETKQTFVCSEEDVRFDEVLASLGRCRAGLPSRSASLPRLARIRFGPAAARNARFSLWRGIGRVLTLPDGGIKQHFRSDAENLFDLLAVCRIKRAATTRRRGVIL
jgi:transposase-like protein